MNIIITSISKRNLGASMNTVCQEFKLGYPALEFKLAITSHRSGHNQSSLATTCKIYQVLMLRRMELSIDSCVRGEHVYKDQPWLLLESEECCSRLTLALLDRAIYLQWSYLYLHRGTQTVLTWEAISKTM